MIQKEMHANLFHKKGKKNKEKDFRAY